jgi:hypothetical protein
MQQLALFMRGTWPYVPPMRPIPPTLGALIPLTVRHFGTNFRRHVCTGCRHGNHVEARFIHTQVQNGKPVTASLKEENGKRHNFFSFWPNEVPKKPS